MAVIRIKRWPAEIFGRTHVDPSLFNYRDYSYTVFGRHIAYIQNVTIRTTLDTDLDQINVPRDSLGYTTLREGNRGTPLIVNETAGRRFHVTTRYHCGGYRPIDVIDASAVNWAL